MPRPKRKTSRYHATIDRISTRTTWNGDLEEMVHLTDVVAADTGEALADISFVGGEWASDLKPGDVLRRPAPADIWTQLRRRFASRRSRLLMSIHRSVITSLRAHAVR